MPEERPTGMQQDTRVDEKLPSAPKVREQKGAAFSLKESLVELGG